MNEEIIPYKLSAFPARPGCEASAPSGTLHDFRLDHSQALLKALTVVERKIERFKLESRDFYFQVMLVAHVCDVCGGRLRMTGRSICACENCHHELDPTLAFQRSLCCGAKLIRRPVHYACSECKKTVASRFLFDEKIFDKEYFCEMMQASRERARKKKEAIRRLLADSRSEELVLTEAPNLEHIPGLLDALGAFIGSGAIVLAAFHDFQHAFDIEAYRRHILKYLSWDATPFSQFPMLQTHHRLDRVYRFITLVFMDHAGEVSLHQEEGGLFVQRVYHEAYNQG